MTSQNPEIHERVTSEIIAALGRGDVPRGVRHSHDAHRARAYARCSQGIYEPFGSDMGSELTERVRHERHLLTARAQAPQICLFPRRPSMLGRQMPPNAAAVRGRGGSDDQALRVGRFHYWGAEPGVRSRLEGFGPQLGTRCRPPGRGIPPPEVASPPCERNLDRLSPLARCRASRATLRAAGFVRLGRGSVHSSSHQPRQRGSSTKLSPQSVAARVPVRPVVAQPRRGVPPRGRHRVANTVKCRSDHESQMQGGR